MGLIGDAWVGQLRSEQRELPEEPDELVAEGFDVLAELFGSTPREQNPRIAAALAGTTDKRSHEYRAAIRNVQRYRRGERTPSERTTSVLARIVGERPRTAATEPYRSGATVTLSGAMRVSKDVRRRSLTIEVPGEYTGEPCDLYDAGDTADAAEAFDVAVWDAYGVPAADLEELDEVDIEPWG